VTSGGRGVVSKIYQVSKHRPARRGYSVGHIELP
jgi:hypothetical protein